MTGAAAQVPPTFDHGRPAPQRRHPGAGEHPTEVTAGELPLDLVGPDALPGADGAELSADGFPGASRPRPACALCPIRPKW